MKVKKVNRYYCDFCKKSGGQSFYMQRHEKHCTLNPKRECRLCATGNGCDLTEAIQLFGDGCDENFNNLVEFVDGCPACVLATIRQSNLCHHDKSVGYELFRGFDFRAASKQYLDENRPEQSFYFD